MACPKLKILSTIVFLSLQLPLTAQNLIKNGSFEETSYCPNALSELANTALGISSPTAGTTDLFSRCGKGKVAVPKNFKGKQDPQDGDSYAGLYLMAPNDYREYIQFELLQTLEKGRYYDFEFYLNLAETSEVYIQHLQLLLVGGHVQCATSKNLSAARVSLEGLEKFSFIKLQPRGLLNDRSNWVKVVATFKAEGFENRLIIGNFSSNKGTKFYHLMGEVPRHKQFAYYYVDHAQLYGSDKQDFKLDRPYVLEGVNFALDDHRLDEYSKKQIQKVYAQLRELPNIKVTINGHTDDQGSKTHNDFLSSRRARSVANYLISLGFPEERIISKGHGDTLPLIEKTSDKARRANRRVDFVITEFVDD